MNERKNELIPITKQEVEKYGWETQDGVAYVLMLDEKRHIDLFNLNYEWTFQLTEEPTLENEEVAIFTGRKIQFMFELQNLFYGLMGVELPVK